MTDLSFLQKHVYDVLIGRGHGGDSLKDMVLRLNVEVSEATESLFPAMGMEVHEGAELGSEEDEFADVGICLLRLAEERKINLDTAIHNKLEKDVEKKYVKVV